MEGDAVSLVCIDETTLLDDIQSLLRQPIRREVVPGFEVDRSIRREPIRQRSNDFRPAMGRRPAMSARPVENRRPAPAWRPAENRAPVETFVSRHAEAPRPADNYMQRPGDAGRPAERFVPRQIESPRQIENRRPAEPGFSGPPAQGGPRPQVGSRPQVGARPAALGSRQPTPNGFNRSVPVEPRRDSQGNFRRPMPSDFSPAGSGRPAPVLYRPQPARPSNGQTNRPFNAAPARQQFGRPQRPSTAPGIGAGMISYPARPSGPKQGHRPTDRRDSPANLPGERIARRGGRPG
jgi:ATP-dependent RNA helicase RhlE